jgi:hypothetical protein
MRRAFGLGRATHALTEIFVKPNIEWTAGSPGLFRLPARPNPVEKAAMRGIGFNTLPVK